VRLFRFDGQGVREGRGGGEEDQQKCEMQGVLDLTDDRVVVERQGTQHEDQQKSVLVCKK